MQRTALIVAGLALSFMAGALAIGQQTKQTTGPQEQPGPFGFPGPKHLTEVLVLNADQANALHRIYGDYQKKEHQAQQEAAKEAAKDKTPGAKAPRVDTKSLRDDMVKEISAILTEEQRKKFDELVADMGKKKKKAT
jgi:Spy/CpxP family protein refolding chaperone